MSGRLVASGRSCCMCYTAERSEEPEPAEQAELFDGEA